MADHDAKPKSGGKVLAFLDRHRLAHTPEHYSFAHDYLNGDDRELRARVDGGVRLTVAEVKKFRPSNTLRLYAPQIDHITLRVLDVVSEALAITGNLNRDQTSSISNVPSGQDPQLQFKAMIIASATQRVLDVPGRGNPEGLRLTPSAGPTSSIVSTYATSQLALNCQEVIGRNQIGPYQNGMRIRSATTRPTGSRTTG